jgi:hypothetical protein
VIYEKNPIRWLKIEHQARWSMFCIKIDDANRLGQLLSSAAVFGVSLTLSRSWDWLEVDKGI